MQYALLIHNDAFYLGQLVDPVEPGVYLPTFGVRSELNVILEAAGPRVTTGVQVELERV